MKRLFCVLWFLSSTIALGKEGLRVTIEVVESKSGQREIKQYIPGTAAKSETTCDSNATGTIYGDNTSVFGTTNCRTTTTPGRPAQVQTNYIAQENVLVIMPDGRHITVWCQAGFRHCYHLGPGTYSAEIKGNDLWIYGYELLSHKEHKTKYHAVGTW